MLDFSQRMSVAAVIAGGLHAAGAQVGTYTDTVNADGLTFVVVPGTLTDGVWTITFDDSPDHSVWTAVAAANIVGTPVVLASNAIQKFGYVGAQRYVRMTITGVGGATGCVFYAFAVTSLGKKLPMA